MRRLPFVLVLAVLFLVPVAPARADEAVERLEQRVEMLLDLVAKLRSEVAELQGRVLHLEAELAKPQEPAAEPEVAVPVEELVEEVLMDSEYAGTYELDREATIDAVVANKSDGSEDGEQLAIIRAMIQSEMAEVQMSLTLKDDGHFDVSVSGMGGPSVHTAAGTWKREGLSFLLRTTHEDGEELDEKSRDSIQGTWVNHRLRLTQEDDDFVLIFKKQD